MWTPDPFDFDLTNAEPLGCGAISVVSRVELKDTRKPFALKIVSKVQVTQQGKVADVMSEKEALFALSPHPFIVTIFATMQTSEELFFVLELLPHGDLQEHVVRHGPMVESDVRVVIAQVISALTHCNKKGLVIRDVKPENLAFDKNYRVKYFDFDTVSKDSAPPVSNHGKALPEDAPRQPGEKRRVTISQIQAVRKNTAQFCGTAQYVSPEMLGKCQWSYATDLWAVGVLTFGMLCGAPLFNETGTFQIMKQIVSGVTKELLLSRLQERGIPLESVSEDALNFILALLQTDPTTRLGVSQEKDGYRFDPAALRAHPFLSSGPHMEEVWAAIDLAVDSETDPAVMCDPSRDDLTEDPQKSFRRFYSSVPEHDRQYSDYVMDATGGAFEEWLIKRHEPPQTCEGDAAAAGAVEQTDENVGGDDPINRIINTTERQKNSDEGEGEEEAGEEGEDDHDDGTDSVSSGSLEIIDDVGYSVEFGRRSGEEVNDPRAVSVDGNFAFPNSRQN